MATARATTTTLRRKRRPANECPNPLFVKWVEEWRDEAREEGSKVQYAYTKALNSLKKYPLPLVSGQEAKILDHIGEKLANKLDKKLMQYRSSEGMHTSDDAACVAAETKKKPRLATPVEEEHYSTTASPKKRKRTVEYVPEYRSGTYAIIIALHKAQQKPNWIGYLTKAQLMTQAQPYSDKSFTIPDDGKYYTAWSSMATLIRKGLVDKRSSPAKFRLTEAGEDMAEKVVLASSSLAEAPPTHTSGAPPSAVRDHPSSSQAKAAHTMSSSSSSSNLANRGSTSTKSSSATSHRRSRKNVEHRIQSQGESSEEMDCNSSDRYPSLSARRGCNDAPTVPDFSSSPPDLHVTDCGYHRTTGASGTIVTLSDSDDEDSDIEILPLASRIGHTRNTQSLGKSPPAVTDSPQQWVTETPMCAAGGGGVDEVVGLHSWRGGEAKGAGCEAVSPRAVRRTQTDCMTPAQRAGEAALSRLEKSGVCSAGGGSGDNHKSEVVRSKPRKVDLTVGEEVKRDVCSGANLVSRNKHMCDEFPPVILSSSSQSSQHPAPATSAPSLSSRTRPSVSASAHRPPSSLPQSTAATAVELSKPLFQLKPGEFDVVLCVDNAESTASRKSNSQFRGILLQELGKNGVKFDVRKLNVGDFLWIAREKTAPLAGQLALPQSREAVLDYIVERKRMDDLASSITDGRFREQKFRLRHSGVKCPMYLVEEFRDALHLKLPHRRLEQAISNVQIIDGFSVHRTTDVRDSVAYLTILTRHLEHHYTGKTIEVYPWDTIAQLNEPTCEMRRDSVDAVRLAKRTLGMEFSSFNEASIKNKTLTVYEMFGRHLMQVPCVSAERAAAILEHYPTVTVLRDAYKKCHSNSEREALISNLNAGQNKKLGKSIGRIICGLYWGQ